MPRKKKPLGAKYILNYEQHRKLLRMYRSGTPPVEIQAHFGISSATYHRYLNLDPDERKDVTEREKQRKKNVS